MAKVVSPLQSTEARGRVAGLIYNTWRGLNTVKSFKSPSQPRSSRQLLIRAYAVTCSRAWAALTAANQAAWIAYATAHPETDWSASAKRLTGHNWYVRLSVRLLDMAKSVVVTPPAVAAFASVAGLVLTPGAGQISCAFTAFAGTATTVDWWIQGPISAGRLPKIERAKHKAYTPGETTPYVITGLTPGTNAVFARSVSETDGQASPFVMLTAVVT